MVRNEKPVTTNGGVASAAFLGTRHSSLVTRHWVWAVVCLALWAPSLHAASRSLFFPHLITGMGFETRLVLQNP